MTNGDRQPEMAGMDGLTERLDERMYGGMDGWVRIIGGSINQPFRSREARKDVMKDEGQAVIRVRSFYHLEMGSRTLRPLNQMLYHAPETNTSVIILMMITHGSRMPSFTGRFP